MSSDMKPDLKPEKNRDLRLRHSQVVTLFLIAFDIFAVNAAYFLALLVRFDGVYSRIPVFYLNAWKSFTPYYTVVCIAVFIALRLYRSIWRYASYTELLRLTMANAVTVLFHAVAIRLFFRRMPLSYGLFGAVFQYMLTVGIRFSYRFVILLRDLRTSRAAGHNVMIIGAGDAGQQIIRDMRHNSNTQDRVLCIIDDNPNKWGRYIDGIPVVGGREKILESVTKYKIDKIYLAMPNSTAEQRRDILSICQETDCELKNLPGLAQIVNGEVSVSQMKSVSIEDLLGREVIRPDLREVFDFINGKVILVTGGGGSIGSELCRQVAGHHPKQLIIFDV